jgi:hypothetical protein
MPSHVKAVFGSVLLAATTLGSAVPFQRADLVGRWKGEIREGMRRTEVTIDFFANGTYARRVSLTSEFGWTATGDILMIAPAVSASKEEVVYGKASAIRMQLRDSLLVISDAQQSISLKRVTVPINESALLGRWEGVSLQNEGITQDFLSDGRLIVNVTLAREAGRYSVDDKTIKWQEQIPEPRAKKTRFRMDAGKLVIYLTQDVPAIEMVRVQPESAAR